MKSMKVLALASLLCACPALFANESCNNAVAANACCKARPAGEQRCGRRCPHRPVCARSARQACGSVLEPYRHGGRQAHPRHYARRRTQCGNPLSPEHGFRGTADAGEHVGNSVDEPTGIPIASLYGGKGTRMPAKEVMDGLDVIVVDIPGRGSALLYLLLHYDRLMNAAKAYGKQVVVLDRPNPNGMYVDGPSLI